MIRVLFSRRPRVGFTVELEVMRPIHAERLDERQESTKTFRRGETETLGHRAQEIRPRP